MHRLGPYLLLTRIGVGGMAEIFLARKGDQVVALKRILPHLAAHDDFVDMFVDEARLAARLRHPNIARVLDVGREDGLWYIAMEYVPGEDLLTIIRRSREKHLPTPLAVGASIIADAAAALHYAHEAKDEEGHPLGLVHRDVTPSNLIVSHEGQVKLVDFGIAKAERRISVTAAGALKGKYAYMAPEHALGEPLDRRADVFSLGVVAWETFTQRRLFHREHELAVLRAVTEERIPIPSERRGDLPAELDEIIMRALDRDRETRWPTARHMEQALRRFVASRDGGEPQHAVADLMDTLFGMTVAEKRRRWAAGDLDDEPATQVETFSTPPATVPRSRVPDDDIDVTKDDGRDTVHDGLHPAPDDGHPDLDDLDDDGPDPVTTVALTPGGRLRTSALPERVAAEPGDRDARAARAAERERVAERALERSVQPSLGLSPRGTPTGARPLVSTTPVPAPRGTSAEPVPPARGTPTGTRPAAPKAAPAPHTRTSQSAFPPIPSDMLTEPIPRISGGSRGWRVLAVSLAIAAAGAVVWMVARPGDDGDVAPLPKLGTAVPEAGQVPAALEVPQLGAGAVGERAIVSAVPRPGEPSARLTVRGPEGAVVSLDGERLGELPMENRRVPAGEHQLTVVTPSGSTQTIAIRLSEGGEHTEIIDSEGGADAAGAGSP